MYMYLPDTLARFRVTRNLTGAGCPLAGAFERFAHTAARFTNMLLRPLEANPYASLRREERLRRRLRASFNRSTPLGEFP
jgi:hypothetical protein